MVNKLTVIGKLIAIKISLTEKRTRNFDLQNIYKLFGDPALGKHLQSPDFSCCL